MVIQHWRAWHSRTYTCFILQWSCYHIPVLWAVMVVIQSTIHWHQQVDIYPSTKHTWSCWQFCQWRCLHLLHIAWNLHPSSVDALADIHGRSHSFTLIHPREVFLAWYWVTTRPLSSSGIVSLSLPSGMGLTGVGLVHLSHAWQIPMHKGMPGSGAIRRSQLQCRMCECLCWSFTLYTPPICPSSSSLERHLPWLGQDHQVSNLQCLFSGHRTTSVSEPLL